MAWQQITLPSNSKIAQHIASLAANESRFCILDSQHFIESSLLDKKKNYSFLAAIGVQEEIIPANDPLKELQSFFNENGKNWYFGHLNYDLKNNIESRLHSSHIDEIAFPVLSFFIPEIVIAVQENIITIHFTENTKAKAENYIKLLKKDFSSLEDKQNNKIVFPIPSKETYLAKIKKIKYHLHRGDIYEMNFCIPFYAKNASINPFVIWNKLSSSSPAPLSCFYRMNDKYLLSASPERFIRKENNRIISQPIKGTSKRSQNISEDEQLKTDLLNNEKERAENVMIVDLVRNDLSRIAKRGTVNVDELFGIYSFPAVHQMISTISAEAETYITFTDILKSLFPMGSMTGAPKIRAMEIIEELEDFQRGLFSGSVGYISPEGDFDFNVIIRSIFYNASSSTLMIAAGSAITYKSDAELEYEECLLKANALLRLLGCDVS